MSLLQWQIQQGMMGQLPPPLATKEIFFVKLKLIKIFKMTYITLKIVTLGALPL